MLTAALFAIVVPGVAAAVCLALRGRLPNLAADLRGIALQTVIIMVVLLAIAGGVAAVLLNRGGEAVTDIERQQISRQASEFSGSACAMQLGSTGGQLPRPAMPPLGNYRPITPPRPRATTHLRAIRGSPKPPDHPSSLPTAAPSPR